MWAPSCDSAISIQGAVDILGRERSRDIGIGQDVGVCENDLAKTGWPWICVDAFTEACTTEPALTMCAAGMV